jgi:hypothetical protein
MYLLDGMVRADGLRNSARHARRGPAYQIPRGWQSAEKTAWKRKQNNTFGHSLKTMRTMFSNQKRRGIPQEQECRARG